MMQPNISNQLGALQSQESLDGCDISIYLSFEKLIRLDLSSKADPYAKLKLITGKRKTKLGKTETVVNKSTGQWTTNFTFRYLFETRQFLQVKVYDKDIGDDDFVGEACFSVGNIMATPGNAAKVELISKSSSSRRSRGYVILRAEKLSQNGFGFGGKINLKLSGHKLESKEWGGLSASDPYYVFLKKIGSEWVTVHKSEYIENAKNPKWKVANISLDKLCNGDLHSQCLIRVYDHDDNSSPDLIGEATLSVNDLVRTNQNNTLIEIKHPPTKSKYRKSSYRNSGTLTVDHCLLIPNPTNTMVDFICGGLNMNLIVAVDFTGSNGNPTNPRSLHYRSQHGMNMYQSALASVGEILMDYSHDGLITAFGFGGHYKGHTSHCFPLNGHDHDPRVQGLDGLMNAYNYSLETVKLSGPTYFAEMLSRVNRSSNHLEVSQTNQSYTVMLILTDGVICDMGPTIHEIINLSKKPISIIIVGLGGEDFGAMKILDADDCPLKDPVTKEVCKRDVVQFIPFRECQGGKDEVARRVLHEVPQQLAQFFTERKIYPNKPLTTNEVVVVKPIAIGPMDENTMTGNNYTNPVHY